MEDVYDELCRCHDKAFNKYPIGQSLFVSHLFYSNPKFFYDQKIQTDIRAIEYSLESNTPLYTTVQKTPAKIVDKFMMYRHESDHAIEYIKEEKIKEKKRKNA